MVYLSLTKSEFTPQKIKEANEESISNLGKEDGKDDLVFSYDNDNVKIEDIDYETGTISVVSEGKFGYISIDVKLTTEDISDIIQIAVKQMNKIKTVFEGLK